MNNKAITQKNTRMLGFDLARGVAIFLMIIQHFWILVASYFFNTPTLDLIVYLSATALVAPVFLLLMGANTVFSSKSQPAKIFLRGLKLIIFAYFLSFLRFFLPLVLLEKINIIENISEIIYKFEPIYYLLQIDILHVAGFSLIILALLKKIKLKKEHYLVLALVVFMASPFLWKLNFPGVLGLLSDSFWGDKNYIVFPFFPWLAYSLVGYYFGSKLLENKKQENDFYAFSLKRFKPILFLSTILVAIDLVIGGHSYSNHGLGIGIFITSLVICWLSFLHLNQEMFSRKVVSTLTFLSKNVTAIYVWQWLIIAWLAILIRI